MSITKNQRLDLERITHRFGDMVAVRDINVAVAPGEIIALLGPSGCGKTTLLRTIAGFIQQTEGRVLFDGVPVDHLRAAVRGVGIVFQNYALFPHMTVAENVAYGLQAHRRPRAAIGSRVNEMLDLVQMLALADRMPKQLSGGQQQRVALARCLATDPKVLLLDEPFGALDKNLRLDMQIEVKRLQRAMGITTILVTHDQEEALSMADRIAVMNRGGIEQIASPTDIYDRPATLFVNQFVGATNLYAGEIVDSADDLASVRLANGTVMTGIPVTALGTGASVWFSLRPEHVALDASRSHGTMPGTLKTILPLGSQVAYDIELAGGLNCKMLMARTGDIGQLAPGATVSVSATSPTAGRIYLK